MRLRLPMFCLIPTMNRSFSAAPSPGTRLRASGLISSRPLVANGGGAARSENPGGRVEVGHVRETLLLYRKEPGGQIAKK